jgi:hypothetical protein
MWQAPLETVELLLMRYPEGATVRNQYGSLPLHMAASNQASPEVVRLLIDSYPDALHLQNDDGMTPLELALADDDQAAAGANNEAVIAMLEGRPPPPELSRRQQADKYVERAATLERKLSGMKDTDGRQDTDLKLALAAVRRLADRFPHALYAAGLDPNELEIAFSNHMEQQAAGAMSGTLNAADNSKHAEFILLDAIKKRSSKAANPAGPPFASGIHRGVGAMTIKDHSQALTVAGSNMNAPRDRVEDLLFSIVSLEHVKSHVSVLAVNGSVGRLFHHSLCLSCTVCLTVRSYSSLHLRCVVCAVQLKSATCGNRSFPWLVQVVSLPHCLCCHLPWQKIPAVLKCLP